MDTQWCPILSVHGILQATILDWAAIHYSRGLPDPGTVLTSPVSSAPASGFFTTAPPRKPLKVVYVCVCVCVIFYFEYTHTPMYIGFPGGSVIKNLPANAGDTVQSLGQEDPVEKEMAVFLPGQSYGWRSLVGYSPLGRKKVRHD